MAFVAEFRLPNGEIVRAIRCGDKPYFCGSDVVKGLGYEAPFNILREHPMRYMRKIHSTRDGDATLAFISQEDVLFLMKPFITPIEFNDWLERNVIRQIKFLGDSRNRNRLLGRTQELEEYSLCR